MDHVLGKSDLEKLPSKLMYASFDNANDNCMGSHIYTGAEDLINNQVWLNGFPNKIRNVLCYVYNENLTGKFNSAWCDYLYFWLGYVLRSNLKYLISFSTVMETLKFLQNSIVFGGICTYDNYDYYYNIDVENFMDIKLLFDFSKDYDHLDNLFNTGERICNTDFKDYIDKYIIIYNKFKNKCNTSNNQDVHCSFFNKHFNDKTHEDLRVWKYILEKSNANNTTQEKHHDIAPQLRDQGVQRRGSYTLVNKDNQGRQLHQHVSQGAHMNADLQHLKYELSEDSHFSNVNPESIPLIDILDSPSANSTSKSMVISFLVIGITVFSILLCKFTPFGYWLKKGVLGKSKRKHNIIMDRNIIEDYTMLDDLDSLRRFNVRYSNI